MRSETDGNPNRYVLGGKPKLKMTTVDENNIPFIPTEARLTIKAPDDTFITVSGSDPEMIVTSGLSFYLYHPNMTGWHEYEGWVRDGHGYEDTDTNGFEVIDRVY